MCYCLPRINLEAHHAVIDIDSEGLYIPLGKLRIQDVVPKYSSICICVLISLANDREFEKKMFFVRLSHVFLITIQ